MSSDDSGSDHSDADNENKEEISQLQECLKHNPYLYDTHVNLIKLLKSSGDDLEALRSARNRMRLVYPLTEDLWMEWLKDEMNVNEDNDQIMKLFNYATADYLSVSIWAEFCTWALSTYFESDPSRVSDVFSRALAACGSHVTEGSLVWGDFRDFEQALLETMKVKGDTTPEAIAKQEARLRTLYIQQISTPHLGLEATKLEGASMYELSESETRSYRDAEKILVKLEKFEDDLLVSGDPPSLAAYEKYLDFETNGSPDNSIARTTCLFERTLKDHPLSEAIWVRFIKWLEKMLNGRGSQILSLYPRAIRNVPGNLEILILYGQAMERNDVDKATIVTHFRDCLKSGLADHNSIALIWLAFIDFMRRHESAVSQSESDEKPSFSETKSLFDECFSYFHSIGASGFPHLFKFYKYYARFHTSHCKENTPAREAWNQILKLPGYAIQADVWLEYLSFERTFGDIKHCRKILARALNSVTDFLARICDAYIVFEREEGDLTQLDAALSKCEARVKNLTRQKLLQGEIGEKKSELPVNSRKRPNVDHQNQTGAVFKTAKENDAPAAAPDWHKPKTIASAKPSTSSTGGGAYPAFSSDGSQDECTVFVSNLDKQTNQAEIRTFFGFHGVDDIVEIRMVSRQKNKFAYVQFSKPDMARSALGKDRELLNGRPAFVSRLKKAEEKGKKSEAPTTESKLKFSTDLEKHKLFVRNVPETAVETDLEGVFSKFGSVTSVRFARYRNGTPKGIAFVEMSSPEEASAAVRSEVKLGEHPLAVEISCPPPRRTEQPTESLAAVPPPPSLAMRPRVMRAPMSKPPPPVSKPHNKLHTGTVQSSASDTTSNQPPVNETKTKSNEDFRAMILGKK